MWVALGTMHLLCFHCLLVLSKIVSEYCSCSHKLLCILFSEYCLNSCNMLLISIDYATISLVLDLCSTSFLHGLPFLRCQSVVGFFFRRCLTHGSPSVQYSNIFKHIQTFELYWILDNLGCSMMFINSKFLRNLCPLHPVAPLQRTMVNLR